MSDKTFSLEHIIRNIAEGKFTPSDEPKVNLSHTIRNVHESVGTLGTDKYKGSQFMGVRTVTPHISPEQHSQSAETVSNARKIAKQKTSLTLHGKVAEEHIEEESEGTVERRKVKFIARPDDADPKSPKSVLGRTGEIKTKIVDEEKVIKGLTDVIINPPLEQVSPDGDKLNGNKPQRDKLKKIVKEASLGTMAGRGIGALSAYDAADNLRQGKIGKAGLSGLGMAAGPVGAAAAGSSLLGMAATGTETGRSIGKWIGDYVPGAKTAADYMRKAGETLGVRDAPEPAKQPESAKPQPEQNKSIQKPVNKQKTLIKKIKGTN